MDRLFADARPGDALIQNYPDPALPYYLHDRMPRILLPRTDTDPMDQVSADLVKITSRFDRIWFQPVPYGSWDTQGLVAAWLDRHARQVDTFQFRGLMLESYLPVSVALRQAQPISATLGNQIQLLAFESTGADQTPLKPGANLHVILYWKALAPIPRDDTVFVHLYRPDGGLEAQQDHQPVDGTYPTTDWKPDEIVVDQYNLIVPADAPSGADLLAAGMYDSETLARLAAVDKDNKPLAENRIPLTTLRLDSAKAAP
jgi:hypothetical protein